MMRLIPWIIILLVAIAGVWFYQNRDQPLLKDVSVVACHIQEGQWDDYKKTCDPDARKNCLAQDYQWDEEGKRCLFTDYLL